MVSKECVCLRHLTLPSQIVSSINLYPKPCFLKPLQANSYSTRPEILNEKIGREGDKKRLQHFYLAGQCYFSVMDVHSSASRFSLSCSCVLLQNIERAQFWPLYFFFSYFITKNCKEVCTLCKDIF